MILPDQIWLAVDPVDMRLGIDGLSLKIQQALGHASIQTTEKYLENVLELQNPACDCLGLGVQANES